MTNPSRRDIILYATASDEAYRELVVGDSLRVDGARTDYILVANRYDPEFSMGCNS
jgi:hypothetical protein